MKIEQAFVGARVIDSLPFSSGAAPDAAAALKASGIDGVVGYLSVVNRARLAIILDAGLAFMPVTLAGEYGDGADDEIAQLAALGIAPSSLGVGGAATVWLDLEGLTAYHTDPPVLIAKLATWARKIAGAGYMPGLYAGSPQPLTSVELYQLPFVRYWWGLGRCVDRFGALAEPSCGWCMIQQYHGQTNGVLWKDTGVFVDTNGVQCDYRKRLPAWVVG